MALLGGGTANWLKRLAERMQGGQNIGQALWEEAPLTKESFLHPTGFQTRLEETPYQKKAALYAIPGWGEWEILQNIKTAGINRLQGKGMPGIEGIIAPQVYGANLPSVKRAIGEYERPFFHLHFHN